MGFIPVPPVNRDPWAQVSAEDGGNLRGVDFELRFSRDFPMRFTADRPLTFNSGYTAGGNP